MLIYFFLTTPLSLKSLMKRRYDNKAIRTLAKLKMSPRTIAWVLQATPGVNHADLSPFFENQAASLVGCSDIALGAMPPSIHTEQLNLRVFCSTVVSRLFPNLKISENRRYQFCIYIGRLSLTVSLSKDLIRFFVNGEVHGCGQRYHSSCLYPAASRASQALIEGIRKVAFVLHQGDESLGRDVGLQRPVCSNAELHSTEILPLPPCDEPQNRSISPSCARCLYLTTLPDGTHH